MANWHGASSEVVIDRPPAAVWGVVVDPSTYPHWVFMTRRVIQISGPLDVGASYDEVGWSGPSHWTVTSFEPPRSQVHEGRMLGVRVRIIMRVTDRGDGTRYEQGIELLPALGILAWPVLKVCTLVITRALRRYLSA